MNFYVTFGQKYRRELHPRFTEADPDGYVRIEAETEEQARQIAWTNLDIFWAFIYTEEEFNFDSYPKGELAVLKPSS